MKSSNKIRLNQERGNNTGSGSNGFVPTLDTINSDTRKIGQVRRNQADPGGSRDDIVKIKRNARNNRHHKHNQKPAHRRWCDNFVRIYFSQLALYKSIT